MERYKENKTVQKYDRSGELAHNEDTKIEIQAPSPHGELIQHVCTMCIAIIGCFVIAMVGIGALTVFMGVFQQSTVERSR